MPMLDGHCCLNKQTNKKKNYAGRDNFNAFFLFIFLTKYQIVTSLDAVVKGSRFIASFLHLFDTIT